MQGAFVVAVACASLGVAQGVFVIPTDNFVNGECVVDFDGTTDLFPTKTDLGDKFRGTVNADYSLLWNVSYHGTYKVLTNGTFDHILYQCGTDAPTADYPNAKFWSIPLQRVATTSTTEIPFLEMIGERSAMKAYGSSFEYVSSPCLRKLFRDGEVAQAYSTATYSRNDTQLEQLGIELTFASKFTKDAHNAYLLKQTDEDSVLKVAEYVEIVALFFNREVEATAAITRIIENYECSKATANSLAGPTPLKVMWSSHYFGTWNIAKCPNWYCEIIEAAGGVIMEPADYGIVGEIVQFGSQYMSTAQAKQLAASADVWIVPGIWIEGEAPFNEFDMSVVSNGRLFDHQGQNGARNWFERRVVEPDSLLQDVAAVLYPASVNFKDHDRKWLRKVDTEAPVLDDDSLDLDAACPDVTAPYAFSGDFSCASVTDSARTVTVASVFAFAALAAFAAL